MKHIFPCSFISRVYSSVSFLALRFEELMNLVELNLLGLYDLQWQRFWHDVAIQYLTSRHFLLLLIAKQTLNNNSIILRSCYYYPTILLYPKRKDISALFSYIIHLHLGFSRIRSLSPEFFANKASIISGIGEIDSTVRVFGQQIINLEIIVSFLFVCSWGRILSLLG